MQWIYGVVALVLVGVSGFAGYKIAPDPHQPCECPEVKVTQQVFLQLVEAQLFVFARQDRNFKAEIVMPGRFLKDEVWKSTWTGEVIYFVDFEKNPLKASLKEGVVTVALPKWEFSAALKSNSLKLERTSNSWSVKTKDALTHGILKIDTKMREEVAKDIQDEDKKALLEKKLRQLILNMAEQLQVKIEKVKFVYN